MKRPLLHLVIVTLLLTAIPVAFAQFGLPEDDFDLWQTANENSIDAEQYAFNYDFLLNLTAGEEVIGVQLGGIGQFDALNEQLGVTLVGEFFDGPEETPLNAELRIIGDTLYAQVLEPETTGWVSVSLSDVDDLADNAEGLIGTLAMDTLGSDAGDLFEALEMLADIDPEAVILGSRNGDEFVFEVLLDTLQAEPAVAQFIGALAELDPSFSARDGALLGYGLAALLDQTNVSMRQTIDPETGLVQEAVFEVNALVGAAAFGDESDEELIIESALFVELSDYGETFPQEIPEEIALEITGEIIDAAIAEFAPGGGAVAVAPTPTPTGPDLSGLPELPLNEPEIIFVEGPVQRSLNFDGAVVITARALELGAVDPILRVFDGNGNLIAENDDHNSDLPDLDSFDSAITDLSLSGPVTVEIDRFGSRSGDIEVLVSTGNVSPDDPDATGGDSSVVFVDTPVQVPIEATGTVTIVARSVVPGQIDPIIRITDETGSILASNDDHSTNRTDLGTRDSVIENFALPTDGTILTLEIDRFGAGTGEVEIIIEGGEATGGGSVDVPDTTTEVLVPGASTTVGVFSDEPTTFAVAANGTVTITASAVVEGQVDPILTLRNADGTEIARNDDHGTDRTDLATRDSALVDIELTGETVNLVLTRFGSGSGEVIITVEGGTAASGNGGSAAVPPPTGELSVGDTVVVQIVDGAIVELELTASEVVTVVARSVVAREVDTTLEIIDEDGNILAENDDHTSSLPNLGTFDAAIEGVEIDGTVTVVVGSAFGGQTGDVEVQVLSGGSATGATEGGTAPSTGGLSRGSTVSGTLDGTNPVNFELDGQAGTTYTIIVQATNPPAPGLDVRVNVFGADDTELGYNDDHGTNRGELGTLDSVLVFTPATDGTYRIQVESWFGVAGEFSLTIE